MDLHAIKAIRSVRETLAELKVDDTLSAGPLENLSYIGTFRFGFRGVGKLPLSLR